MAKNGAAIDKKGVAKSQVVSRAEIFEEPCFLINRKGKCKVNDSMNIKMPIGSGSNSKNPLPRPQAVCKAGVFKRELDGKTAEYQTANLDTLRTYNLDTIGSKKFIGAKDFSPNVDMFGYSKNQARSDYKPSQQITPVVVPKSSLKPGQNLGSGFDWSNGVLMRCQTNEGREKAKSRKKPKAEQQDDPIFISPVAYKDKSGKQVKLEALNTDRLSLTSAGSISCLIESNRSFLELPAALPSSSYKRRTMESNKRMVLLKGPKMKLWRVEYHETPELNILKGGWEAFCKYNNILPGDECTFEVENESEDIFRVTVVTNL